MAYVRLGGLCLDDILFSLWMWMCDMSMNSRLNPLLDLVTTQSNLRQKSWWLMQHQRMKIIHLELQLRTTKYYNGKCHLQPKWLLLCYWHMVDICNWNVVFILCQFWWFLVAKNIFQLGLSFPNTYCNLKWMKMWL